MTDKKATPAYTPCHVPLSLNVLKAFIDRVHMEGREHFPLLDAQIPVPRLKELLDQYDAKKHPFLYVTEESPTGLVVKIGKDVHVLEGAHE